MAHSIPDYLRAISVSQEKHKDQVEITGDTCLVAVIPSEELNSSTRILIVDGAQKQINSLSAKRPVFVKVLAVGPGFYSDGGDVGPGVDPGDILLVGSNAVQEISQFGKLVNHGRVNLGLMNASDRLFRWKGQEGFDQYFETLLARVTDV